MLGPLQSRMESYLDLLAARQKVTASNIANADTPGYRAKDIDFQFEYQSLTDAFGPHAQPHVIETPGLTVRNDGNNVNMDREMRILSENALRFQFVSQLVKSGVSQYRRALRGGN